MTTESERVDILEHHLDEIERQIRKARDEQIDVTPWDFNLPSGRDLRSLRQQCDLTCKEVGEAIDYSENTVYQIENGHKAPGRKFIQQSLLLYKREWPR